MKHQYSQRKENEEGKSHRSLSAGARSGSAGLVSVLELVLPLTRFADPFLVGSARLADSFLGGSGLGATTSSRITSSSESSGESTAIESGLEVPSLSLAFAFSSASLARSLTHTSLSSRILWVRSCLEFPTSSFFQLVSRAAFGVFCCV